MHLQLSSVLWQTLPAVLPMSSLTVKAGEEIILGSDDEIVTEVTAAEVEVKLSWQTGNLIFRGESLVEDRQWKGNQPKLLLGAIIARGSRRVSKELLMEDFWEGAPPFTAETNFRVMSSLCRVLDSATMASAMS